MPVKDLDWLGVPLHAPVIHRGFGHQGDHILRYPLPEDHIVDHRVRLHLGLHLDVEDLKRLLSCKTVFESGTKRIRLKEGHISQSKLDRKTI